MRAQCEKSWDRMKDGGGAQMAKPMTLWTCLSSHDPPLLFTLTGVVSCPLPASSAGHPLSFQAGVDGKRLRSQSN